IAGVLAAFGMNILKAEAFSNARGIALDTLTFADPNRTLDLNPSEADQLRDTMLRAIRGGEDVRRLVEKRRRRSGQPRRIQPSVAFNNEASNSATLVEIVAED